MHDLTRPGTYGTLSSIPLTHLTMRCPNLGAAAGRGGSDDVFGGGPGGPLAVFRK